MKEKINNIRARRIIDRYESYSDFSINASRKEKTIVIKSTVLKANKLQRKTAGV